VNLAAVAGNTTTTPVRAARSRDEGAATARLSPARVLALDIVQLPEQQGIDSRIDTIALSIRV
jgi:hypothetical protein